MTNYTYHQDPGHGWIEVPKAEISRLNIKPSPYSYQDKNSAYLEEDCDASLFIEAKKAAGEAYTFTDKYKDGDSFIRSLKSY
jgi:hypothetical protein